MNFHFIKPNKILDPYIERYWIWDSDDQQEIYMPHIPPGIGMDLFLHYKDSFVIEQKGKLSSSHIIYSGEKPCNIVPMKNIGFIAIRFRAGAFRNFTEIPLSELMDSYLDVENIWGYKGKNTLERIKDTRNIDEVIQILESFLMNLLDKYKKENKLWHHTIQELYYHHNYIKLPDLSQKLNISYRHFRRKFIEEAGFTPKRFQQLVRFRSTLKPLLMNKEKDYLPVALSNGYFDQTHFIKEFKHFTKCTPSEFLQEKNFMSHFYYPSW